MISQILNSAFFELSIKKRQLSTYVYFAIFLIFAFIITLAAGGAFKGVVISFGLSNKVLINSPFALNLYIGLLNAFGLFIIAPVFGQAIYKDFGAEFEQIIYSTSAKSSSILIGRFIGALLTLIFVFSGIAVGIFLGTLMPSIQQNLIGEQRLLAYIYPYLITVIPNTIIFGAIFYLIISKTKSMAAVYITGIVIFMGWNLSGQLMKDIDNKMLLALADPFSLNATSNVTEYWSIEDQNNRFVTLTSYILYNRLFWGIIGLISLSLSLFRFSIHKKVSRKKIKNEKVTTKQSINSSYNPIKPNFNLTSSLNTFKRQFKFEVSQIFSSIYFKSISLAGVLYLIIVSFQLGKMFGTTTYPVTYKVLDLIGGSFNLFIIIIIALYAGEAIWREKDNKINQIIDACPVSNLNLILSKTLSLVFVAAFLFFIILVSGLLIQVFKGYNNFELSLYFNYLYGLKIFSTIAIILLAVSFHVTTNNKYISHGLIVLYYIAYTWLPSLGFEHELYLYDSSSVPTYSDMNGFGRFLKKFYIYRLYWLSLASAVPPFFSKLSA
jgi:ABC-2 type transport system permease protein